MALARSLLLAATLGAATASAQVASVQQTVTVTATDRGLLNLDDASTSAATLNADTLSSAPGFTLDDALHQVAGFQLFRRTSSWTANPTSQGVSLRGLGSTAASRTLVVSDEVPLNDPFGGWVHWNEIPTLALNEVDVLRGGASDLYGSSAIGGVINAVPLLPGKTRVLLRAAGASESTALGDALVSTGTRKFALLGAFSALSTGGYITTAPAVRGPIDIPANVSFQSARIELRTQALAHTSAFLRGNVLNEWRSNGTPLQTNAARLWRYSTGAESQWGRTAATLRLYGSREGYRQSFTSVPAARASETLTKLQRVPSDELGLVLQGSRVVAKSFTAALGFDVRDIRATDSETTPSTGAVVSTSARQRATGGFAEALWQPAHWSLSASVRADSFRTFDVRQNTAALPTLSELFASPRLGVVRTLPGGVQLVATAFRAFRGPTLNELYRTSQVGSQVTQANSTLLAERATGVEGGVDLTRAKLGHLRATYFWTEVNRPISAVLLSTNLYQRQNLGQLRSRGTMIEAQSAAWRGFDLGLGYQYAVATVTAPSSLAGKWLPEVPRHSLTATANFLAPRALNFHAIASYQGREYDDTLNTFELHPYARFDLSADRTLTHGLAVFASAQNLLDRTIEAGRTPLLTLAPPRIVEAGLRYSFTR